MTLHGIYTTLNNSNSIRVLELRRSTVSRYKLQGDLAIVALHGGSSYTALSYVWGEPSTNDVEVEVNQCPKTIRRSLFEALMELTPQHGTIKLWIDQICINQDDDREKGQQVGLMSLIYSQADKVVAWLGKADDDCELAFKFIGLLSGLSGEETATDISVRKECWAYLVQHQNLNNIEDLLSPAERPWMAVTSLVQRAWFHRLWIVQEVVLAKKLELRCGEHTVSAQTFFAAIQIQSSMLPERPLPEFQEPYRHAYRLGRIRAQFQDGKPFSLPHLAQTLCLWGCAKSQDRLNALHGVVFPGGILGAWTKPSYTLSTIKYYTAFAENHIRETGGLDILHFAGCGDEKHQLLWRVSDGVFAELRFVPPGAQLPSWVPDWRIASQPRALLPGPRDEDNVQFSATKSHPEYVIDTPSQRLRVRALKKDKIKCCGLTCFPSSLKQSGLDQRNIFNSWFEIAKHSLHHQDVETMFASTLLMDGKVQVVEEKKQQAVSAANVVELFRHWRSHNPVQMEPQDDENWKDGIEKSARFASLTEDLCRNRKFFITEAGSMGLGSNRVSCGDSIYLIHGLRTPFVVHQNGVAQFLRGDCYLYGLMESNAQRSEQDTFLELG